MEGWRDWEGEGEGKGKGYLFLPSHPISFVIHNTSYPPSSFFVFLLFVNESGNKLSQLIIIIKERGTVQYSISFSHPSIHSLLHSFMNE